MRFLCLLAGLFFVHPVIAQVTVINSAYHITGDPGAAPIQVFDDGRQVYVQLRDINRVPAPFVNSVPINYSIFGHYLMIPMHPSFELRLGSDVVRVQRAGLPSDRVAEVFRSVDALVQPEPLAAKPPIMPGPFVDAPITHSKNEFAGQILLEGELSLLPAARPSPPSSSRQFPHGIAGAPLMFADARGKRVRIVADGTVAGAREAERLRGLCKASGTSSCDITYNGAPRGVTSMEIL